jgi:hypothetical protein
MAHHGGRTRHYYSTKLWHRNREVQILYAWKWPLLSWGIGRGQFVIRWLSKFRYSRALGEGRQAAEMQNNATAQANRRTNKAITLCLIGSYGFLCDRGRSAALDYGGGGDWREQPAKKMRSSENLCELILAGAVVVWYHKLLVGWGYPLSPLSLRVPVHRFFCYCAVFQAVGLHC